MRRAAPPAGALLAALALSACGGGGGGSGVGLPPGSILIMPLDPAITLTVGAGSRVTDTAPYFSGLAGVESYAARSSDTGVATASVPRAGGRLTVGPVSAGSATVTVEARAGPVTHRQRFPVTVLRPGAADPPGTLPPVTLRRQGEAERRDVAALFADTGGYSASSSSPGVVSVEVSGRTLTMHPVGAGSSTVAVTVLPAGETRRFRVEVVAPDLAVVSPPVAVPGSFDGVFTVSATVRNDGREGARGVRVRFHRSEDATITPSDELFPAEEELFGSIQPGGERGVVAFAISDVSARRYYGVCVDVLQMPHDADPGNNCSSGAPVTSEIPVAVGAIAPVSLSPGDPARTVDVGPNFSHSLHDRLSYAASSSDAGVAAAGILGSMLTVTPVAPGYATLTVTASNPDGLGATHTVDVTVGGPRSDLAVSSGSASDDSLAPGQPFTLTVTVANEGPEGSHPVTMRYLRSDDPFFGPGDPEVASTLVGAIPAGEARGFRRRLTAPTAGGEHLYGVCVDGLPGEVSNANNCSSGNAVVTVYVGTRLAFGPVSASPAAVAVGQEFTLTVAVRNLGGSAIPSATLQHKRSDNRSITSADTDFGAPLPGFSVPGGGERVFTTRLTAPTQQGVHYFGACVTAGSERDCTGSGAEVTVTP